ncbi:hypothetical protein GLX30_06675 [Streptomyces sp. Tu 2975]|uniref:hypothetical protein n=1 Tax=Streptomyces sp. Tu 2975 TaxID=2676871 RepID=UPI00135A95D2|nr:hypothetical protein [Streptomyces sp. Tu 2975]QIP83803.1 hypothetical protein GLX30_06675 [Streptomyces sp. Tu 2975]
MTTLTTRQPTPQPTPPTPEGRRHMIVRRWITAIVIVLLIGIPAGYLVISAGQSRASGRDKEAESAAQGLRDFWPSIMKRRIFEVPVPKGATRVSYFETSNWKTSRLYVQFRTSPKGLDTFLKGAGTSRAALENGKVTIGDRDSAVVGWNFKLKGRAWAGTVHNQKDPRPSKDITVDLTEPDRPWVYVVSTANP